MSDAGQREWRFYLDDMIDFAEKVLAYTDGLDQDGFVDSDPLLEKRTLAGMVGDWPRFLQAEDPASEAHLLQKIRTGRQQRVH